MINITRRADVQSGFDRVNHPSYSSVATAELKEAAKIPCYYTPYLVGGALWRARGESCAAHAGQPARLTRTDRLRIRARGKRPSKSVTAFTRDSEE